MRRRASGTSLRTRVFLVNATVFVVAGAMLVLTPATVSVPTNLSEAVVLATGLTATVLLNLLVVGRTFEPLRRLSVAMERFDPLRAGYRVPVYGNQREIVQLTRAFNDMLDRIERERRDSVQRSLAAQERERQRVAQELHDEIGQSLTALLLQIEGLERSAPADEREELSELRQATRDTLNQVREVARRLRPEVLDDLGLAKAIAGLCDRLGEQSGIAIHCELDPSMPQLPPEAELVTYRVAQEALTNTLRHSSATRVDVHLGREGDDALLTVTDDGRGLDGAAPGAGIQGMHERALLIGADLAIEAAAAGGTEVRLRLDGRTWEPRRAVHETLGWR
jgi:two-component system, NarL family, sensor histidine kinase UhpB